MPPTDTTFNLHPDADAARHAAEALFAHLADELARVLPPGAEIVHVGATAIPGCITKGDLDLVVRVPAADFERAEAALATRFDRNAGSVRTADFAAFEVAGSDPPCGIQLSAIGGEFDDFKRFAEALVRDPDLVARYNALKERFDGAEMETYRAEKSAFIAEVLGREASR